MIGFILICRSVSHQKQEQSHKNCMHGIRNSKDNEVVEGSGDLRQGSSNNSVTNFVQGFPYVFQREKQPFFEDLLLVVFVILRQKSATIF